MMTMLVDLGLAADRDALGRHLGHALLVDVLAGLGERERRPQAEAPAVRLRAAIAARPREGWTLERMSEAVGMSARTLTRRLASDGAPTAPALLWRARVRQNAELLVRSRASCAEIADLCGFQNTAHFSRRVRHTTGMTPIEIRIWGATVSFAERASFFRGIETG